MLNENIELENCRDARMKLIEQKKNNRGRSRKFFSQLQKQFRKGKTLNQVRVKSKYLHDGV